MKIKSIYIASFGKFKNFTLDLSDGFNVIYGENEKGKSTITALIKMIFYGNSSRVSDLEKNLRKKYMPWDSQLMAGSVVFEQKGKTYRLEREFRGSNSTDRITLTDLSLGESVPLSSRGDIGSEVFGLSESAFEKSVFIGSLGAPEKNSSAEGEINSKLSNITSTGDEDISLETVSKRLQKAKEALMSRGGKIGIYDKTVSRISELEEELSVAQKTELEAKELEEKIASAENEIKSKTASGNEAFYIMKKAELFKKKQNLERYVEAYRIIESANSALGLPDGSTADENYAVKIKKSASALEFSEKRLLEEEAELDGLKEEISTLQNSVSSNEPSPLEEKKKSLNEKIQDLESLKDQKELTLAKLQASSEVIKPKHKPNILFIILGILLFISGGAFSIISYSPFGFIISAVGLIIFALSFVFKTTEKTNIDEILGEIEAEKENLAEIEAEIKEQNKSLRLIEEESQRTLIERASRLALIDTKRQEMLKKQEEILSKREAFLNEKSQLFEVCKPFMTVDSIADSLIVAEKIEELLSTITKATVALNLAADGTNCQSIEEAKTRLHELMSDQTLANVSAEDIASAKDDFRHKTEEVASLREELASLKGKLNALLSGGKTVPVLEIEIAKLKESASAQREFCNKTDIALSVLSDAFAEMRQGYSNHLRGKTEKIFSNLTNNSYSSVEISKDFEISVTKEGVFGSKDWQFLSAGTADQAYLSLRLATAELIADSDDALPIIMDDILSQYDDERTRRAISFLSDFSKEHQMILFTCHNNVKELAEKTNATIKEL